ncbi:hypothetical protein LCM17_18820 [Cereibacter sphaeroides]|nr:hypothetical protein [Cereibacter sphaeroides]
MTPSTPRVLCPALLALAAMAALTGAPAHADGEFFQADYGDEAQSITATIQRDRVTASLGWSGYVGGHATALWVNYGFQVDGPTWFRLGPALRVDQAGVTEAGVRMALERFTMTDTRTLFLLADANTIQHEFQILGQLGHIPTGLAAELSYQGNDQGFRETTLAGSYRLGDSPFRLRAGYRFNAQEAFIGFSINTF